MYSTKEEWCANWFSDVCKLLDDSEIKYSFRIKYNEIKERYIGNITVSNAKENIDKFVERIGFCYNAEKTKAANVWKLFRNYESFWNADRWKKNRLVRKTLGTSEEVSQKLGLPKSTVKYHKKLYDLLYSEDLLKPEEYLNKLIWKENYVKLPIRKENVRVSTELVDVYNLTSGAANRFFAEGIFTHNCEEIDYIDQEALVSAILPLLQTNPNTEIVGFSTPTGAKTPFYYMCEENPNYKEFHYTYKVLPWWEEVEKERSNYTQDQWTREYLADWTASETNVYKNSYVEKAIGNYLYENYRPMPTWRYCIGTDWNEKFGTEIAVLGFNTLTGFFQVVETMRVERSEFTQLLGISKLLEMNKKWRPDFIYIDSGNGSTNAELLRKTAYDERRKGGDPATARLLDILKKYDSGAAIEVKDPLTHTTHRAPAKPFMVNASIRLFEQERIKISSADTTLIKQLRNYVIERTTPSGVNVYGMTDDKIGDHRLDALNLAIVAFHLEFDDLYKINPAIMACGSALDPRIMERDERGRMVPSNENRIEAMERRLDADVVPKTELEKQLFRQQPGKLRDPLGGIKTNRPGWDTDQEEQKLAEFIQRRRSRVNKNSDKPTRSKF
jgi:hypothetical protein